MKWRLGMLSVIVGGLALDSLRAAADLDVKICRLRCLTGQPYAETEAIYTKARAAGHSHEAIIDAARSAGHSGIESLFSTRDHPRVREMAAALGMTTPWSSGDWLACMTHAVDDVVRQRRERFQPVDGLRDRLFDRLGELTQAEIDAVANYASASGLGLRSAAQVLAIMLVSAADQHDPTVRTLLAEDVPEFAVNVPDVENTTSPHEYRIGAQLGRRLGVRR
jgi:truncated hemoglobin YjbI